MASLFLYLRGGCLFCWLFICTLLISVSGAIPPHPPGEVNGGGPTTHHSRPAHPHPDAPTRPPLSPALQQFHNASAAITLMSATRARARGEGGGLTMQDLEALAAEFSKVVVQNDGQTKHARKKMEGCPYSSPESALNLMHSLRMHQREGEGETSLLPATAVYLSTPCLTTDSFGNFIANYLEGRMCANFSGLHYVATNKGWDIPDVIWNDANPDVSLDSFLHPLPGIVQHPQPLVPPLNMRQVHQRCPCSNLCHLHGDSLIGTHPRLVQQMLTPLYLQHRPRMREIALDARFLFLHTPSRLSPDPNTAHPPSLPTIPDVAIHYRCGDNVHVSGYGLLRFSTIRTLIAERDAEAEAASPAPQHQYVYVLSEDGNRKTLRSEKSFCSHVLLSLHDFLVESFPNKTIATLRGARIFDDMTRLALAPTMISSWSSFGLYPAMTNSNRAYFPVMSKNKYNLFSNQQPFLGPAFKWLSAEHVIPSDTLLRMADRGGDKGALSKAAAVVECLISVNMSC